MQSSAFDPVLRRGGVPRASRAQRQQIVREMLGSHPLKTFQARHGVSLAFWLCGRSLRSPGRRRRSDDFSQLRRQPARPRSRRCPSEASRPRGSRPSGRGRQEREYCLDEGPDIYPLRRVRAPFAAAPAPHPLAAVAFDRSSCSRTMSRSAISCVSSASRSAPFMRPRVEAIQRCWTASAFSAISRPDSVR